VVKTGGKKVEMMSRSIESSRDRLDILILAHKTYTSMEKYIHERISISDIDIYLKDEFLLTENDKNLMEDIKILDKIIEKERKFFEYLYGKCFPNYSPDR
jgi:hypothetical protein